MEFKDLKPGWFIDHTTGIAYVKMAEPTEEINAVSIAHGKNKKFEDNSLVDELQ